MHKPVDRVASEPPEQDHFAKLECLETLAPKGSLSVSKLVSAFEDFSGSGVSGTWRGFEV